MEGAIGYKSREERIVAGGYGSHTYGNKVDYPHRPSTESVGSNRSSVGEGLAPPAISFAVDEENILLCCPPGWEQGAIGYKSREERIVAGGYGILTYGNKVDYPYWPSTESVGSNRSSVGEGLAPPVFSCRNIIIYMVDKKIFNSHIRKSVFAQLNDLLQSHRRASI